MTEPLEQAPVPRAQAIVGAPSYEDSVEVVRRRTEQDTPAGDQALLLRAVHISGVADLDEGESGLELRMSELGLDIIRGGDVIGRLPWEEIHGFEVTPTDRRLRRRARPLPQLLIRADDGEASFGIPGLSPAELREHLTPFVARYVRR